MNKYSVLGSYFVLWAAVLAGMVWGLIRAGLPSWAIAVLAYLLFLVGNAALGYKLRVRRLRLEGKEPPPFFRYLIRPVPWSPSDRVPLPKPLIVLFGLIIFAGGVFFTLCGILVLIHFREGRDFLPLLAIFLSFGVAFGYVGARLMIKQSILKGRRA